MSENAHPAQTTPLEQDPAVLHPPAMAEAAQHGTVLLAAGGAPGGPRVRWAGIIWGIVFVAFSVVGLLAVTDPAVQAVFTEWWFTATPLSFAAVSVLGVGVVALLCGLIAIARRSQRSAERRREQA